MVAQKIILINKDVVHQVVIVIAPDKVSFVKIRRKINDEQLNNKSYEKILRKR